MQLLLLFFATGSIGFTMVLRARGGAEAALDRERCAPTFGLLK